MAMRAQTSLNSNQNPTTSAMPQQLASKSEASQSAIQCLTCWRNYTLHKQNGERYAFTQAIDATGSQQRVNREIFRRRMINILTDIGETTSKKFKRQYFKCMLDRGGGQFDE